MHCPHDHHNINHYKNTIYDSLNYNDEKETFAVFESSKHSSLDLEKSGLVRKAESRRPNISKTVGLKNCHMAEFIKKLRPKMAIRLNLSNIC